MSKILIKMETAEDVYCVALSKCWKIAQKVKAKRPIEKKEWDTEKGR
jgi:hypothetical protein